LPERILILLCSLLLAATPLARAGDGPSLSADTGWQRLDEKNAVSLFSRSRVGSGVKEFKGTGVINASPSAVEKVLQDVSSYPSFMPYVTEARIISHDGTDVISYQRLDPPLVTGRDYTIRVEFGTTLNASGLMIYRDTWQTDNEAGPPVRHGVVRVKVDEGSWLLEPVGQATYQIYTDSGGALPTFLANKASQMAIPRLFEAVRKQVAKAQR